MKKLIFAVVVLAALPAFAAFHDGNTFLAKCEPNPNSQYCIGYAAGLVDAIRQQICIPAGTTGRQVVDTLLIVLRENPDIRQLGMDRILRGALTEKPLC